VTFVAPLAEAVETLSTALQERCHRLASAVIPKCVCGQLRALLMIYQNFIGTY